MSHISFVLALFFWYKYDNMIKIRLVNFYNLIAKSLPPEKKKLKHLLVCIRVSLSPLIIQIISVWSTNRVSLFYYLFFSCKSPHSPGLQMLNGFAFDLSGFMTFLLAASGLFSKNCDFSLFCICIRLANISSTKIHWNTEEGVLQWIEIAAGIEERHIWANTNFIRSWFISK